MNRIEKIYKIQKEYMRPKIKRYSFFHLTVFTVVHGRTLCAHTRGFSTLDQYENIGDHRHNDGFNPFLI